MAQLLNSRQAADYTGLSLDFVRRVLRYEVPVVQHRPSGPIYFRPRDLDRWLDLNTQVPAR